MWKLARVEDSLYIPILNVCIFLKFRSSMSLKVDVLWMCGSAFFGLRILSKQVGDGEFVKETKLIFGKINGFRVTHFKPYTPNLLIKISPQFLI